ncbi:10288_t:CDS:1, partial [Scutellospora calospora]
IQFKVQPQSQQSPLPQPGPPPPSTRFKRSKDLTTNENIIRI